MHNSRLPSPTTNGTQTQPKATSINSVQSKKSMHKKSQTSLSEINCQSKTIRSANINSNYVNNNEGIKDAAEINSIGYNNKCGPKATINSKILNTNLQTLLDTGSQINAISQHELPLEVVADLAPSNYKITSYTNTEVEMLGTFETDVQIGSIIMTKCFFYVTRNPCRTVIGTPAITSNNIIIDLAGKIIKQGEKVEPLNMTETSSEIEMCYVGLQKSKREIRIQPLQFHTNNEICIPKLSTKFIRIDSKYDIETAGYYATMDAFDHNLEQGILVGKSVTLLGPNQKHCILRICNVNNHDVYVQPNRRIVNLHAVEVQETNNDNTKCDLDKLEQVMADITIGSTNENNIRRVKDIVANNLDAFAVDNEPLGCTDKAEYDIDTGTSAPVAQTRYRTPYYLRGEMERIINQNVKNGLMEPCSSPYAAPVLLVKKQNGTWRLVCDYRKLNNVTISDSYPLPEIADLVTSLSQSKVFSAADLWTGFHQIPCSDRAKEKLAITTEFGQYTWLSMPMGGKNAPSVFQRLMDRIFRAIPRSELVIYLDDILIHSADEEQNINQIEQVLKILKANNLKIRATKTEFLQTEIQFCGYIISDGKRKPNPKKVQDVLNLKTPSCKSGAQSLFGLLNYHRHFIPKFSKKAAPITNTYKGTFKWTTEAAKALDKLKNEIADKTLSLRIPSVNDAYFVLETDASNCGYGACLYLCNVGRESHTHNAKCLRPIEYTSRQFDTAQKNYSTFEKELFAGRESLRKWSHFLLGRRFTWQTDNSCLQWAHRVRSRKLKISQWLSEISEYDIHIDRRPSTSMKVSDCLSRQFAELNALHVTKTDLRELQINDEILAQVREFVSLDRWPNNPAPEIESYNNRRTQLVFGTNGELLLQGPTGTRTIPPDCIKSDIIKSYHDENGHPGERQTIGQLQRNYFWPGLTANVKSYIHTCHQCQVTKPNLHPKKPPLGKSETPDGPWQMLSWDLIGPLPITDRGNRFILTGHDLFSKHIYATALQTKSSDVVCRNIKRILLQNPQMPKTMLTDNGTEFNFLREICRQYNIIHKLSAPYNPATNGGVERSNQTLKNRLFCHDMETWDERLYEAVHSINCSENAVTKLTPFQIETGHAGRNVHDFVQHDEPIQQDARLYSDVVRTKIINEKQERVTRFANDKFVPYNVGDTVVAQNMVEKFPRFLGPYKITEVRGKGLSYNMKHIGTGRIITRGVRQLKPYNPRQNSESMDVDIDPKNTEPTSKTNNQPTMEQNTFYFEAEPTPPSTHANQPTTSTSPHVTVPHDASPRTKTSLSLDIDLATHKSRSSVTTDDNMEGTTDIASDQESVTNFDNPTPNSPPVDQKLSEFTKEELVELAGRYNLTLSGPKYDQLDQINSYFKDNFPDHPRSRIGGILLFPQQFTLTETRTINQLSKNQLQALRSDYKIPRPTLPKSKDDLKKYISNYIAKHIPDHPKNDSGVHIFTPVTNDHARREHGVNNLST